MTDTNKLTLTFCGGVGSVTGANFLLQGPTLDGKSVKILVDCGMEQGGREADAANRKPFIYDAKTVDMLLVTHAHIDHVGLIPKLVRAGFAGVIYSTPETKELANLMLQDASRLQVEQAEKEKLQPLYDEKDYLKAIALWKTIPYHKDTELAPGYNVYLKDAGHVLGSSMFDMTVTRRIVDQKDGGSSSEKKTKIVFTGDLGNSPTPLLRDTEDITGAEYVVMESVYGDKNHEDRGHRLDKLENAIEDNHRRKGVLIIPAFSLEKTQELLYEINNLVEDKRVPPTPVYLDSPLAIRALHVYERHIADFNETAQEKAKIDNIFQFSSLVLTESADQSKIIKDAPVPKIIISGSGMSNGGRVLHHELNHLGDPNTTLLLIGYQAVGTLGRQLSEGSKKVKIYGVDVAVNCRIEHIDGYSSHKDSDHLLEFISKTDATLKKVFVVMGETKSSLFLVQRIRDYLGLSATHPNEGDVVELE